MGQILEERGGRWGQAEGLVHDTYIPMTSQLLGSTVFPANPEGTPNVPGELFATPENTAFFCCPPNGEEGWLCFNWEKGDAAAPAGVAFESGLRQVLVAKPAPRP